MLAEESLGRILHGGNHFQGRVVYEEGSISQETERRRDDDFSWKEGLSTCGLWNCPFEASDHPSQKEECFICAKEVPNRALFRCGTCKHSICVLCLLRIYANRAVQRNQFRCCFCRQKYNNRAIQQLRLFYDGHKRKLPVELTTTWTETSPLEQIWHLGYTGQELIDAIDPEHQTLFGIGDSSVWGDEEPLPRHRPDRWILWQRNQEPEILHRLPLGAPPPVQSRHLGYTGQEMETLNPHDPENQTTYELRSSVFDCNSTFIINHLPRNNYVRGGQLQVDPVLVDPLQDPNMMAEGEAQSSHTSLTLQPRQFPIHFNNSPPSPSSGEQEVLKSVWLLPGKQLTASSSHFCMDSSEKLDGVDRQSGNEENQQGTGIGKEEFFVWRRLQLSSSHYCLNRPDITV